MAEVHALVVMEWIMKLQYLESFSVVEIIGLLSCFTNIRVSKFVGVSSPNMIHQKLQDAFHILTSLYQEYETMETSLGVFSGYDYKAPIMFDIVDEMMIWSELTDTISCKALLQTVTTDKGISTGDSKNT